MSAPIVVIGDVMLDVDRCGVAERLSPEAPVPVLRRLTERRRPGGAALAALLAAQGDRPVILVAPFADDNAAAEIRELLDPLVQVIALPWTGSTPLKTRILAGNHPIARLDDGDRRGAIGALPDELPDLLGIAAAVLISDYGRGAAAHEPLRTLLATAIGNAPVVWDPHPKGAAPIPGVMLVTPNESELLQLAGAVEPANRDGTRSAVVGQWLEAARLLGSRWQTNGVCVTVGERGAMLCLGDRAPMMVPAQRISSGDTCGAGDSFAAAVTCALADGAVSSEAVAAAVRTAGDFVAAGGAAGFDPPAGLRTQGAPGGVTEVLARVRASNGVVVATGGCFDLLHAGHVATLAAARALGDCLIVCLNSDASVRRLKGAPRPLQPAADRATVLAALQSVDAVVVFEEDTPAELLATIRPDLWAKGGDYAGLDLPEAAVLAEWGGQAVTVPYLDGRSTSAMVELVGQASGSR